MISELGLPPRRLNIRFGSCTIRNATLCCAGPARTLLPLPDISINWQACVMETQQRNKVWYRTTLPGFCVVRTKSHSETAGVLSQIRFANGTPTLPLYSTSRTMKPLKLFIKFMYRTQYDRQLPLSWWSKRSWVWDCFHRSHFSLIACWYQQLPVWVIREFAQGVPGNCGHCPKSAVAHIMFLQTQPRVFCLPVRIFISEFD